MIAVDSSGAVCAACGTPRSADRCAHCGAASRVRGYQVVRVLSQQPHRRVYLVTAADGARGVLKELSFSLIPDAQTLEAFHREAQLLRQLSHPRLPTFLESFQEGEGVGLRLYLAMSYVEGASLLAQLETHRFDEAEVLDIAAQVLQLLVYLHGLSPPVIHRDVKPANLLRKPDGTLALVDFGAAREVQRRTAGQATVVGTPGYMPPEQLLGLATPGSDVYALGATLIHLLGGEPPDALLGKGSRLELPKRVKVRSATRRFLARLVEPRASKRFATAAQALAALPSPRSTRASRGVLAWTGALLAGGTALVLAALAVQPERVAPLLSVFGAEPSPLDIRCPWGSVRVEEKYSRWCKRLSFSDGPEVRHGPFVSWDGEGRVYESSHYRDGKFHGPYVKYQYGSVETEGEYHEGRKTGPWRTYDSNRRLRSEEHYQDGVLHGPFRGFGTNGNRVVLEEEGTYEKGNRIGVWLRYRDGHKVEQWTYAGGKPHGPHAVWFYPIKGVKKGTLKTQGTYADGDKTGTWTTWFPDGQKESEGVYKGRDKDGAWSTWFPDGKLASRGTYQSDQKTGTFETWFPNGQKESEGLYERGFLKGPLMRWREDGTKQWESTPQSPQYTLQRTWHPNGQLASERLTDPSGTFAEGAQTLWHPNGKMRALTVYKHNQEEGIATTWHDNGRKASEGAYLRGSKTGTWRWWTPKGKVERVEEYPAQ